MSSEKDKFQEEWQRAINNPDNMIVSDSLMDRLGTTSLEEEAPTDAFLQCTLVSTSGNVISGRTASFQQTEEESTVSFETTHSTANTMLSFGNIKDIIFSLPSAEEEVSWNIKEEEKVSKRTEFFAQNDALITIVITHKKASGLDNSYTVTMET